MSNLNLTWLASNLNSNAIIFDIGAADLTDTVCIKSNISSAIVYAFECSALFEKQNKVVAANHDINYFHTAISDMVGTLTFYPSKMLNGKTWPWSGSICKPGFGLLNEQWQWGETYTVQSTTLESFCIQNNVSPDFIHIDVQGAEYKVFSAIGSFRPTIVWAEISEFHQYDTGTTYDNFKNLMSLLGYQEKFKDNYDALYILNNFIATDYTSKDTTMS
jgi:FkbM family methyltransferase